MDDKIIMLPVTELYPHPDNPRRELGDLTALENSILERGVLQNLTVTPREGGGYTVLGGHRRRAAAINAGLEALPCVVIEDISLADQIALMLCENMQRNELTLAEQAQGVQMMIDLGIPAGEVAKKTGLSESTVRRRLKLAEFDKATLERACSKNITIDDILSLSEIKDAKKRDEVLSKAGTPQFASARMSAISEQRIAEALPLMTREFDELAEKTDKVDWDKYTYRCNFYARSYVAGDLARYITREEITGKLVYSQLCSSFTIYSERPQAGQKNKSPDKIAAEKRRAEFNANKDKLEMLTADAYDRRCGFVEGLRPAVLDDKFFSRLCVRLAVASAVYNYRIDTVDTELYLDQLGVTLPGECDIDSDKPETYAAVFAGVEDAPAARLRMVLYALGDSADNGYIRAGYASCTLEHKDNPALDLIYDILAELGYTMTDWERQLKDGTHPLISGNGVEG